MTQRKVKTLSTIALGWLLALLPTGIFALIATQISALSSGSPLAWRVDWLPSLGISFGFYLDGLSAFFALLVSGIGALVLVYAGYYFAGHHTDPQHDHAITGTHSPFPKDARFFLYLMLFMACMLGLVLAGDIITLFVFWEGTSITSFLLVAYHAQYGAARRGAFRALFITAGGGIALLAGLIFVATIAGSSDLATILTRGDALRDSPLYAVALGLVAFGAFTKSAQVPAHFWLPGAMSAPTPASAYLHSATMVKAGLYLMARLYPALGGTEMWFWLLSSAGLLTMLTGALFGLRQNDLKGLLAYSTVSQLGVLMLLIGQNSAEAFNAFIVGLLAHALYKGALFLTAGVIDHAAHTRDLRKLASMRLAKAMPLTFAVGLVAALSMAGLPPVLGFLAKESLLAAALHESAHAPLWGWLIPAAAVVVGALMLAQAGIFIIDSFLGTAPLAPHQEDVHPPPVAMLLAPAVLGGLSILFAFEHTVPLFSLERWIGLAATASFGAPVEADLALFHGLNTPLILSGVAIVLGNIVFALRRVWVNRAAFAAEPAWSINHVYEAVLSGLDGLARIATRLQSGNLRRYLAIMLVGIGALVFVVAVPLSIQSVPQWNPGTDIAYSSTIEPFLRVFSLILVVAASATSVLLKRDLLAILALGASGLAMALLIALEPSPDVALVQIVVDVLTTVLLLFALMKLPKNGRFPNPLGHEEPSVKTPAPTPSFNLRDAALAAGAGLIMTGVCFYALTTRPRESVVTPYYEQNSEALTGAHDIVGAIVVDFRGFDTMIEITVFGMAGLAVFTVLRFAAQKHLSSPDAELGPPATAAAQVPDKIFGVTGPQLSQMIRMLAQFVMPAVLVIGAVHMIYGHKQPGDGFTAGVIISLGIGFTYLVFGHHEARRRLPWLKSIYFIGAGMLVVMIGSIAPMVLGGAFFAPYDFGLALNLPLPKGFYLSTSFMFEIAICLTVIGSGSAMLDTLQSTAYDSQHHKPHKTH